MSEEYRLSIESTDSTYIVILYRVNIDPAGYHVADFESRSAGIALSKAAKWIADQVAA